MPASGPLAIVQMDLGLAPLTRSSSTNADVPAARSRTTQSYVVVRLVVIASLPTAKTLPAASTVRPAKSPARGASIGEKALCPAGRSRRNREGLGEPEVTPAANTSPAASTASALMPPE